MAVRGKYSQPYSQALMGMRQANPNTGLQGFDQVMANINKEIAEIEGASLKGLLLAAAHIRRQTEDSSPKTPVDTGNLRESWFVVSAKGKASMAQNWKGKVPKRYHSGKFKNNPRTGHTAAQMKTNYQDVVNMAQTALSKNPKDIVVIMGYAANYAFAVHENIGHHFKREGAGPKWFETAIKNNSGVIVKIIANNIKR